ncbi:glycoside hydrolase domain-containing protein [Niabella ginsengisoli]|uniref:DUF6067 family protein n=1 Tax=Niabella ginsengisoli TaxID=522298 RepID=A0ABS9SIL3_9BACT|nr:glycoside hydrolase domain-containing protein [Niabella ginsengisoli]MCH5598184.1 DUF6067 family protein [Niabella ginsengisoli]
MKLYIALFGLLSALHLKAQDLSLALQKAPKFSTAQVQEKWERQPEAVAVGFISSDESVAKDVPPAIALSSTYNLTAWRGEKVHAQILISSKKSLNDVSVTAGDLKGKDASIEKNHISTGFVQYVMADEFAGGCGHRKSVNFDSSLRADIIDTEIQSAEVTANSVQPVWVSIAVPSETRAGMYSGVITVNASKNYQLKINVKVIDRILPAPSEWKYDLDLWQHPAAVARIHKVKLWSDEHFSLMKKYYTMLAEAGQKNITASIVNEPWGHQTYDDYPSLIKWIKKANGSWEYDYSLFDKYVEFVMSCGIKGRISCYSMVPWKIAFSYYDEGLKKKW